MDKSIERRLYKGQYTLMTLINGEYVKVRDLAEKACISWGSVWDRLKRGVSLGEALCHSIPKKVITKEEAISKFKKGEISIHEIAKYAMVKRATVYRRIERGDTVEEIMLPGREASVHICSGYPTLRVNGKTLSIHIIVAEEALGKKLPVGVRVHHVDGDRSNFRQNNLVICEDHKYHMLLHMRLRALKICGNANYRKCNVCKEYGDPVGSDIYVAASGEHSYHRSCKRRQRKERTIKSGGNK